jgi:hypothetical protein
LTCGFCSAALQRSTSRCRPEGRRYKGVGEILRSVLAWSGRDLSYKAQGAVVADVLSAAGGLTCGFCSAALQRSTSRCRPEGRRYKGVGEILRSVLAWSGRDLSYKAQGAVVADVLSAAGGLTCGFCSFVALRFSAAHQDAGLKAGATKALEKSSGQSRLGRDGI